MLARAPPAPSIVDGAEQVEGKCALRPSSSSQAGQEATVRRGFDHFAANWSCRRSSSS